MVLSQLFKSAEMHDRGENAKAESSSDSNSYRRQLTVEELFKGELSYFVTRKPFVLICLTDL